ncbi:MAG: carboxypeptidase-like regulatory domain-containing protein [Candidatus Kapaibacterium sp.]
MLNATSLPPQTGYSRTNAVESRIWLKALRFCATLSLITLFVTTSHPELAAQSPLRTTISGTVLDSESGEPVVGATISIQDQERTITGCVSDLNGRFSIALGTEGDVELHVRTLGFESFSRPLTLRGDSINLTIKLEGTSLETTPVVVIGQSLKGQRRMVGAGTQVSPKTIKLINPIGTQEMLEYVPGSTASQTMV